MKQALGWPGALVLVTLATVFSIATAADTMYRWVDADGNVHYSDQAPPAGAKEARSLNRPQRSAAERAEDEADSSSYIEKEAEFQERREKNAGADAEAKKEADIAATWDKNCDISRNNLETLTDPRGGRVREKNAQGELVYVPEDQRQRQMAKAREDIKKWCKG
jgi:hypothetical protein